MNSEDDPNIERTYAVAEGMGILHTFPSPSTVTAHTIVERIMNQRDTYTKRYKSRAAKEAEYLEHKKEFVEEK